MQLISIIVPIYNSEKYLKSCLDSIAAQTYKNIEVILVDDGSTDNSGRICDEYAAGDPRIKCIHQRNGGRGAARNAGIDAASGEYILFVDSDDRIAADMTEYLVNGAEKFGSDTTICGYYRECGNKLTAVSAGEDKVLSKEEALKELFLDLEISSYVWNQLVKTDIYRKIGFPIGINFEDLLTVYKRFAAAEKIAVLKEPKYYYSIRPDSLTGQKNGNTNIQRLEAQQIRTEDVTADFPQYADILYAKYFRSFRKLIKDGNIPDELGDRVKNQQDYLKKLLDDLQKNTILTPVEKKQAAVIAEYGPKSGRKLRLLEIRRFIERIHH